MFKRLPQLLSGKLIRNIFACPHDLMQLACFEFVFNSCHFRNESMDHIASASEQAMGALLKDNCTNTWPAACWIFPLSCLLRTTTTQCRPFKHYHLGYNIIARCSLHINQVKREVRCFCCWSGKQSLRSCLVVVSGAAAAEPTP